MLRGERELALLRSFNGLWLLGATFVAFLRDENGPNSVGAGFLWHFCANKVTPCDWLGEAELWWHFCDPSMTFPLGQQCLDISAFSQ